MFPLVGYMYAQFRGELEDAVGADNVHTDLDSRAAAAVDHYWVTHMWRTLDGEIPLPEFVVRPASTLEVSRVVSICNTHKIPLVVRGGGSGTQGGAATPYGGIVLDLKRMDQIIEINEHSLILTAEAGINGRVLEDALNERGFMLAHYPSSVDLATLGGYLAARGSGVMSTKYGKAEDMVLSIEVVLPDGRVLKTHAVPNHANGPGLLDLFVGSEGTLGVITKVSMRLDPLPEARLFRVFEFPTVAAGLEAGRQIMTERLVPAVLRLYDEGATKKSLADTGHDLKGVNLVIMVDGHAEIAESYMNRIMAACMANDGIDRGEAEGRHWWEHRYDFYRPPLQPTYPLLYGTVETITTYDNIEVLYEAKKKLITEKYAEWDARYTAHFSHWYPWGTMIYDRFYIESPPADAAEAAALHAAIWADASRVNLEHDALLNEHHGIGLKLGWLMKEQNPVSYDILLGIKKRLDPQGIMNPGKLGFGVW